MEIKGILSKSASDKELKKSASEAKPGLTPKGEKMPDTVEEWEYLCNKYAELIDEQKAEIERLKYKVTNHSQRMEQYRKRIKILEAEAADNDLLLHIPKGG